MLLYLAALPVLPGSTAAVDAAAGQPYLGRCPVLAALLESPVLSPLWRQLLDSGAGSSGSSDAVTALDVPGLLLDTVADTFEVRGQRLRVLGWGDKPDYG